jgi:hypothetical protein
VNITFAGDYYFKEPPKVSFIPTIASPGQIPVQKYNEADFTLLGIPLNF